MENTRLVISNHDGKQIEAIVYSSGELGLQVSNLLTEDSTDIVLTADELQHLIVFALVHQKQSATTEPSSAHEGAGDEKGG